MLNLWCVEGLFYYHVFKSAGKLFMCSHADGTLTTWNYRQQAKPVTIMAPHSKVNKSGKNSPCKPINRLEWKSMKSGYVQWRPAFSLTLVLFSNRLLLVLSTGFKVMWFESFLYIKCPHLQNSYVRYYLDGLAIQVVTCHLQPGFSTQRDSNIWIAGGECRKVLLPSM